VRFDRSAVGACPAVVTLIVASAPAAAGSAPPSEPPSRLATSREVYQAACAACHGADGTGRSVTFVGFDIPLPDFTDCSFASREPAADWFAVVHDGGPVRGFDPMMPAFGRAMTAEEIEMAVAHVMSFCDDAAWPRGELNLPRPLFTEKAYPEDEAVVTTGVSVEGAGLVENELVYEKRFGARNQFEIAVPFDIQERDDGSWSGGIGDFALGVKRALAHDRAGTRIVSAGIEVILPTGEEDAGRGTGTTILEPFGAYGQVLPWEAFLHLGAGLELPADRDRAGREAFWRGALGRSFVRGDYGRTWSPMIEVLGARELESGASVQWDVVPQFQVTLNTRQHVMANMGVRIPVTDSPARSTMILTYFLWDWFDGGLFDGW
jgi:hypothetical protein